MIREATEADIPWILALGKRFADESGVTEKIGWDDDSAETLIENLIASEDGILLRGDKGMIGGVVYGHPYAGTRIFQELFWRSEGFEGVRLLDAAERAAKAKGAERAVMIAIDGMPATDGLYARRGYEPAERLFIKRL